MKSVINKKKYNENSGRLKNIFRKLFKMKVRIKNHLIKIFSVLFNVVGTRKLSYFENNVRNEKYEILQLIL